MFRAQFLGAELTHLFRANQKEIHVDLDRHSFLAALGYDQVELHGRDLKIGPWPEPECVRGKDRQGCQGGDGWPGTSFSCCKLLILLALYFCPYYTPDLEPGVVLARNL